MKVVLLGTVLGDKSYTDKTTKAVVGRLRVDAGDETVEVPCANSGAFRKFDQVVITGDLRYYEKRWYFQTASIRVSSRKDVEVLDLEASATDHEVVSPSVVSAAKKA